MQQILLLVFRLLHFTGGQTSCRRVQLYSYLPVIRQGNKRTSWKRSAAGPAQRGVQTRCASVAQWREVQLHRPRHFSKVRSVRYNKVLRFEWTCLGKACLRDLVSWRPTRFSDRPFQMVNVYTRHYRGLQTQGVPWNFGMKSTQNTAFKPQKQGAHRRRCWQAPSLRDADVEAARRKWRQLTAPGP